MSGESPSLDFSPVALVKEELSSYERSKRLHAVRGIKSIARVIGNEMSRNELMKVIEEHIASEEEDEVLYELANVIDEEFLGLIGGSAIPLIKLLRDLARVEETVVHQRATKSLSSILQVHYADDGFELAQTAIETLKYLLNQEIAANGLGGRLSTVYLVPAALRIIQKFYKDDKKGGGEKVQLVCTLFCKLAKDDSPSVRRAAAEQIGAIANCMYSTYAHIFADDLSLAIWELLCDEHDSVRVVAILTLGSNIFADPHLYILAKSWTISISSMLTKSITAEITSDTSQSLTSPASPEDKSPYLYNSTGNNDPSMIIVSSGSDDPSWRVRQALCKSLHGFLIYHCKCTTESSQFGNYFIDTMLSVFAKLFYDREPEVRVSAFNAVPHVAAVHRGRFAQNQMMLTAVSRGASAADTGKVRLAAARALTSLLAVLSPYKNNSSDQDSDVDMQNNTNSSIQDAQRCIFDAVNTKLFSCIDTFTSEGISPNVDVLLEALAGIKDAVPYLPESAASRIASLVQALNHDNWRVRRALINTLPSLAAKCGRETFESQLLEMFVHSFQDRICQVRMSAIAVLAQLCDLPANQEGDGSADPLFNSDWLLQKITKRLSELYLSLTYFVYRITIVQAFEILAASSVLSPSHMKVIITFLSEATKDDVANVRLAAARALRSAVKTADDNVIANMIRPVLNEIQRSEADIDVKLIVFQALQAF